MSISIYQASVPLFQRAFGNLSAIIDKAVAHAEKRRFDPEVLVVARLYPDMGSFAFQIQRASDTAKATAANIAGVEMPSFADTEKTIAELRDRIRRTLDFIGSVAPEKFEGGETRSIKLKRGGEEYELSGEAYLLGRQIPNFYFHITTAYDILRHNGVEIGKRDYLG